MSQPTPPPNNITKPLQDSSPQRGCLGAALRGLLVTLLSVALSVAAVAALAFYMFGYTPEAPAQMLAIQNEAATSQASLAVAEQRADQLATDVAGLAASQSSSREALQELQQELVALQSLSDEMRENAAMAATVQLEARDARTAVALFSTAQAQREAQVDELQRRADRIARFLARLSDISADTALDLDPPAETPQPLVSPTPFDVLATPESTVEPTIIAPPTATALPLITMTPTQSATAAPPETTPTDATPATAVTSIINAVTATPSRTATATSTGTVTAVPTRTPTP